MPAKPQVAMVLLREPQDEVLDELWSARTSHGGELLPAQPKRQDNTLSFYLGDDKLVVSAMEHAVPWDDLRGPCTAAWYWPEAARELRAHQGHVLVVIVPGTPDRKAAALKLTKVTAAPASSGSAAGVFWGGSGTVHAPKPFCDTVGEIRPDRLPVEIWVGFGLIAEEGDAYSVYTSGLEAFGMQEIEIHSSRRDPQFLYSRLFDVVHYLLRKGVMLHDGETIGIANEEQITIQQSTSVCDGVTRVLQLDL